MANKKKNDGYLNLVDYDSYFYLLPADVTEMTWSDREKYPRPVSGLCYDVKLNDGREFLGCELKIKRHDEPRHGIEEEAFFIADGLEIKMPKGTMLRQNDTAIRTRLLRDKNEDTTRRRQELLERKARIDEELKELE